MREPRALFSLVPVGSTHLRLLAVGGQSGSLVLGSTEWYDQEENEWSEGPTLETGRKSFGALMAPVEVACTEIDPPPHSCPALDTSQSCLFQTTAGLSLSKMSLTCFAQNLPILGHQFLDTAGISERQILLVLKQVAIGMAAF